MEILHNEKYTEINIGEMGLEIDDIFHECITKKTGITINHEDIYHFIGEIILENNRKEIRREKVLEELTTELERLNKEKDNDELKNKLLKFLHIKK